MYKPKLKRAPLQEVIFELFWTLPLDEFGFPNDPGFQLAQGVFSSKIKESFPVYKHLMPVPHNVRVHPKLEHQFWKDELTWPLVQLGPGVLAVNDTEKNYVWQDNFLPNVQLAVQTLLDSYHKAPQFERAKLRYVDAVEFEAEKISCTEFIARNLNTRLENKYQAAGNQRDVLISQTFELANNSLLQLNIQNGVFNETGNPAIVWTTAVERLERFNKETLIQWLEEAHEATSKTFVNMLNPDFYADFDK